MKLSGLKTRRIGATVFVALPEELREPIPFGCECRWCKAHPELKPMWDTLSIDPEANRSDAHTVHFPELLEVRD
jgi:hypothetical protein